MRAITVSSKRQRASGIPLRRAMAWIVLLPVLSCGGDKTPPSSGVTAPGSTPSPDTTVPVQASAMNARPAALLTLTSSFNTSATTVVRFKDAGSYSVDVSPIVLSATSLQVATPPYLGGSGQHIGGTVTVQVIEQGVPSPRTFKAISSFQIQSSPSLPGTPGALTENYLYGAIELGRQLQMRLDAAPGGGEVRASVDAQMASLSALLAQVQTLRQQQAAFSLGAVGANTLTVNAATLGASDQSLADMLAEQAAAGQARSQNVSGSLLLASASAASDCVANQAANFINGTTMNDPDKFAIAAQQYAFAYHNCTPGAFATAFKVVGASGASALAFFGALGVGAGATAQASAALLYAEIMGAGSMAAIAASFDQGSQAGYDAAKASAKQFEDLLKKLLPSGSGLWYEIAARVNTLGDALNTTPKPPNAYILVLTPVGNGTITADQPDVAFTTPKAVRVTAVANSGWKFDGFAGDCSGTGQCTVTMDSSRIVGAFFSNSTPAQPYVLSLSRIGSGNGAISAPPGGPAYAAGTPVTVTARPATGSAFIGFSGACSGYGTGTAATGTCPLTMNANKSVTATFNSTNGGYTLTLGKNGTGSGTIAAKPGSPTYAANALVTVTATADDGSTFIEFSGACLGKAACIVNMSADKAITATFNTTPPPATYTLTNTNAGTGTGTVTRAPAGPTYTAGTQVILLAVAGSNSRFDGYSGDCTGNSCVLTMNSNKNVTATFTRTSGAATPFALTITTAGNGSGRVSASPPGPSYALNTQVQLTAVADPGSTFTSWSGACSGALTSCLLTMITSLSATATFTRTDVTNAFDGSYTGVWSSVAFGPESGPFAFTVANGAITVTAPGGGSGQVNSAGSASFRVGLCPFIGTFVPQTGGGVFASGSLSCPSDPPSTGIWSASRR